jgi:hypothetical protein
MGPRGHQQAQRREDSQCPGAVRLMHQLFSETCTPSPDNLNFSPTSVATNLITTP